MRYEKYTICKIKEIINKEKTNALNVFEDLMCEYFKSQSVFLDDNAPTFFISEDTILKIGDNNNYGLINPIYFFKKAIIKIYKGFKVNKKGKIIDNGKLIVQHCCSSPKDIVSILSIIDNITNGFKYNLKNEIEEKENEEEIKRRKNYEIIEKNNTRNRFYFSKNAKYKIGYCTPFRNYWGDVKKLSGVCSDESDIEELTNKQICDLKKRTKKTETLWDLYDYKSPYNDIKRKKRKYNKK